MTKKFKTSNIKTISAYLVKDLFSQIFFLSLEFKIGIKKIPFYPLKTVLLSLTMLM